MRINKLIIGKFGKLNDVQIGLDDKITVICGKNEAGKSSVATFIRYMLYGFSGVRAAEISDNDKKKYMPWDSDCTEGEMTFTANDGKVYTVVRKNSARSQSAILDGDGNPVLKGEDAGQAFLGIGESAYRKTAFVGQTSISFSDEGELDSAIHNMVFSADEGVDSAEVIKKLEGLRRALLSKTGRAGKIRETEDELNELKAQKVRWQGGHKELMSSEYQLEETSKKIAFNSQKLKELAREKENLSALDAGNRLSQLEKLKTAAKESKSEFEKTFSEMTNGDFVPDREFYSILDGTIRNVAYDSDRVRETEENLERAKNEYSGIYSDKEQEKLSRILHEKGKSAVQVLDDLQKLRKNKKTSLVLAIILTLLVVTLPVAIFFYVRTSKLSTQIKKIAEEFGFERVEDLEKALSANGGFDNAARSANAVSDEAQRTLKSAKHQLEMSLQTLRELMTKAGTEIFTPDEAKQYLSRLDDWLRRTEAQKKVCDEGSVRYNTFANSIDMDALRLLWEKYDESIPLRDEKTVLREITFYTQANEGLTLKERELEKKAAVLSNTLPKPSELQSKINSLASIKDDLTEKCNALDMALEALEKASENMKSSVAPRIASDTGTLFSRITGGKYRGLYTDNDMKLTFLEAGSAEVRDAGYLSAGTLDSAYICLRVTLCGYLCKENPTLIFDDAFSNMDDERLRRMLDFLAELSENYQIVILSCHDREKKYLSGRAKIIDFEVK